MDLVTFTALVANLVRDDEGLLVQADIDTAVNIAFSRYSRDEPNILKEDVLASAELRLDQPLAWNSEFSEIRSIEYPLDQSPPCMIPDSDFYVYEGVNNVEEIRLVNTNAIAGATFRLEFTAKHSAPETIPGDHIELVAAFAAAHLCDHLAARYSHDSDSTFQSDSVDHADKGRRFALRASSLRGRYEKMFKPRTASSAASAVTSVNQKDSNRKGRFYH